MNLLVRLGPAPDGATRDFTDFTIVPLPSAAAAAELFGGGEAGPAGLVRFAAAAWRRATAQGHGHMLIGVCSSFAYAADDAPGCGRGGAARIVPKDYTPLYAVMRFENPADDAPAPHFDLGLDYRGTRGPGDENVRPQPFDADAQ